MKIRAADATGCPVCQFVVEPETETERLLLKAFVSFSLDHGGRKWKFCLHGSTWGDSGLQAFNFGWAPDPLLDAHTSSIPKKKKNG